MHLLCNIARASYFERFPIFASHFVPYARMDRSGLRSRDFNANSLSTYGISTLYTTLPHNLIKDKRGGSSYLACYDRSAFLLRKNLNNILHGLVKISM